MKSGIKICTKIDPRRHSRLQQLGESYGASIGSMLEYAIERLLEEATKGTKLYPKRDGRRKK